MDLLPSCPAALWRQAIALTTECLVADLPEKKEAAPAGGGMDGDFDY